MPGGSKHRVHPKFVVKSIESHRDVDGEREFLVYWQGYSNDEASWEPEGTLADDAIGSEYITTQRKGPDFVTSAWTLFTV